jgi:hypothetical protein
LILEELMDVSIEEKNDGVKKLLAGTAGFR